MRTLCVLLTVLVCLTFGWADQAKEGEKSPSGKNGNWIVKKSAKAYGALKSYVGTTTVNSKSDAKGTKLEQTATAKISFVRPGKLHIEGTDTSGKAFTIVSDGKGAWLSWAVQNEGKFTRVRNVEMAIAGMTGVASMAPTIIPTLLMDLKLVSSPVAAEGVAARDEGREEIEGVSCHKVVVEVTGKGGSGKFVLWVDAKTFLLRQMTQDIVGEDVKSELLHSFAIEKVDGAVDEALFKDPTLPAKAP